METKASTVFKRSVEKPGVLLTIRSWIFTPYFLFIALLLTACGRQISTSAAIPGSLSTAIPEKVDVGGYRLWVHCAGQGSPTVIVEAGYSTSGREWSTVASAIEKTTRICVYDRAGLGQSDRAPIPRTSVDMAQDLHTLLVNARITPPYILVGHSIGGFNVRMFASQYPDEVAGMILVESSHPDQWTTFQAVLPPETPGEAANLKTWRQQPLPDANLEGIDFLASADEVRAAGSFGAKPLIVLSASPNVNMDPNLPADVEEVLAQTWQELQVDLLNLSSNSTRIVAAKAGHNIQYDEPQLVIDAILTMVAELKK
jgi:pimeloyl-ACP methyl ester carboxylesterase